MSILSALLAVFDIPASDGYVRECLSAIKRRRAEGFTDDDIREVMWWCADRWEKGDRFVPYRNPAWFLGDKWFAPLLAMARREEADERRTRAVAWYVERYGSQPTEEIIDEILRANLS